MEAFTKVLEVVLIGDIKPKMKMKAFKFDEVGPSKIFNKIRTDILSWSI